MHAKQAPEGRGVRSIDLPILDSGIRRRKVVSATPKPFYPRERDLLPILQEAGRTFGALWMGPENLDVTRARISDRPVREKSCPSATLSTTNPTWTDQESNPGLHGEKPATNRLSHGTALLQS
jgi:hypothetical protein